MEKGNQRISAKLALIDNILAGLFIIAPVAIFAYVLYKLYWFIWENVEFVLFFVPNEQINKNPEIWHFIAAVGTFFILWFLGWTRDKKILNKTSDQWLDYIGYWIPSLGYIYRLIDKAINSFRKDKTKNGTTKKGKVVILPSSGNEMFMQVGNIMSDDKIYCFNYFFKKKMFHNVVNFQPAFNVAGGSTYLIPEIVIKECESHIQIEIPAGDSYQLNVTGGKVVPDCFVGLDKESV